MSSSCPQCGNPINEDFGVVTCSKCQSVLFVDMEGSVQVTESASEVDSPLSFHNSSENPSEPQSEPLQDFQLGYQSESQEPQSQQETRDIEFPQDQQEAQAYDTGEEASIASFEDVPPAESLEEAEPQASGSLNDVTQFANSDLGLGALSYSVIIENIDTKETRQLLLEILSDSRFHWNSQELLKQVKMGKLKIENINPTKASVLVQKVSEIPVKVSWKQNAFN